MEIRPATITQLGKGRDGKFVQIADDVQGVANGLNAIDPHIKLRYSEAGGYFVVYWSENPALAEEDDAEGNTTYLIFTAQDLDHRIVKKMERVYWECNQPGYSFADVLEKKEAADKASRRHEARERNGEMYERLAHAMRKDLGYGQGRISTYAGESA